MNPALQQKLKLLDELIQQERDFALSLKVAELQALQEEKRRLLIELKAFSGRCPAELKEFVTCIREENRRNARLLWTTLNFLRQSMNSCCRQLTPIMYGKQGNSVQMVPLGVLHAGRV